MSRCRQVPGIHQLNRACGRAVTDDKGCVLHGQLAFAEQAVRPRKHLLQWEIERHQRTYHRPQIRREHGCRHAFAGYIGNDEIQASAIVGHHVAVVTSHHSGRAIVISNIPARNSDIGRGQQPVLYAGGQFQVVLEGALLVRREAIETNRGQRIAQYAILFHRALADLAHAQGSVLNARQRLVNLAQQIVKLLRVVVLHDALNALTPDEKIAAYGLQEGTFDRCHSNHLVCFRQLDSLAGFSLLFAICSTLNCSSDPILYSGGRQFTPLLAGKAPRLLPRRHGGTQRSEIGLDAV